MTYRTYSGPRGSQAIAPLDKDRLLYKEFDTLDAALAWARHVNDGGRVALLIEGRRIAPSRGSAPLSAGFGRVRQSTLVLRDRISR